MYKFARKLLFSLDPELSHEISLELISAAERLNIIGPFMPPLVRSPVEVMGLKFPNAVGLAAGLDKNGDCFNGLGKLGFGFVEIGTVTPKPQQGNPKPRLFRLIDQQAIINRMGFNNKGVEHLVERVKKGKRFPGILGINIGKNKTTAEQDALNDYLLCLDHVYPYADYVTINISSPNTPGLRDLQFGEALDTLLSGLKQRQHALSDKYERYVPMAVKLSPDTDKDDLVAIAKQLVDNAIDAVVATNTTVSRNGVEGSEYEAEAGGLSGMPLQAKSTETIRVLAQTLQGKIPIIGVGGICSAEDALEKVAAGASLVQIYSGFIYQGPALIHSIAEALASDK